MRTTIIDIKFMVVAVVKSNEESERELRIRIPHKGKPENIENYRKIIKLLEL